MPSPKKKATFMVRARKGDLEWILPSKKFDEITEYFCVNCEEIQLNCDIFCRIYSLVFEKHF